MNPWPEWIDSLVPLMHHDPDRSWITNPDPDPDHPKEVAPLTLMIPLSSKVFMVTSKFNAVGNHAINYMTCMCYT